MGVQGSLTGVQNPTDHARKHHEEHGQQLEVPTQDAPRFHMRETAGCQATLNYHLPGRGAGLTLHPFCLAEEIRKLYRRIISGLLMEFSKYLHLAKDGQW